MSTENEAKKETMRKRGDKKRAKNHIHDDDTITNNKNNKNE